jgi:cytochrome c-type biogenesis protein CcmH
MPFPKRPFAETLINALVGLVLMGGVSSSGLAVIETYEFSDPAQESRYQDMIAQLRCLVCQNQNLADSNAELAKDLRARTYEMINAGASDEDIANFMIARYGDFVLYKPPLRLRTTLLWGGPFALLLIALIVFFFTVRRSRVPKDIEGVDREAAARLLDKKG